MKGFITVRKDKNRDTQGFDGMKYSPELIRQLEDPEYAKKADAYERRARKTNKKHHADMQDEVITRNRNGRKGKKKNKKPVWKRILMMLLVLCVVFVAGVFISILSNTTATTFAANTD